MWVLEQMKECVVHVVLDAVDDQGPDERVPIATAFFVGEPLPGNVGTAFYAVTARHVIEDSRHHGSIYLRVRHISADTFVDIRTHADDWWCHPFSDVAIIRVRRDASLQMFALRPHSFVEHAQSRGEMTPGLGDEIFFIGLFTPEPGKNLDDPIMRFGRVSRLADQRVSMEVGPGGSRLQDDAFLVETRSWGGHSGAPAFLFWPHELDDSGRPQPNRNGPWLLGLVHGHSQIREPLHDPAHPERGASFSMNAGIAIVVPSIRIAQALAAPGLVTERERLAADVVAGRQTERLDNT